MSAWCTTLSGRIVEFADPQIDRAMILTDVARGLAVQPRFAGQTQLPISVAQHSVIMAEAILDETGDAELAAFGLLHDAHEAFITDIPTPVLQAITEAIDRKAAANGVGELVREALAVRVRAGVADVKRTLDRAIIPAAGLSFPRFEAAAERIHEYDLRAMRSERDDLMGRQERPWPRIEAIRRLRTRGAIRAWTWIDAEDRFRDLFARLCPKTTSAAPARAVTAA